MRVTSIITLVEVPRAVARRSSDVTGAIDEAMASMVVLDLSRSVASMAAVVRPATVRSLDAIHLASALEIGPELDAFVTYDRRLAIAAREAGLSVASPGTDIWSMP